MEKIYYDELLNHKVLAKQRFKMTFKILIILISSIAIASSRTDTAFIKTIGILIITGYIFLFFYEYFQRTEIKKLVAFYNDCSSNNKCIEADNDLKNVFIDMSEDIILNKLQIIWEPDFKYNDETQVYRVENTNVIIVDGYFEDDSVKSKSKIHYNLVFVDCEYYMSCINNMICWEKSKFWAYIYTKKNIQSII